MLQTVAYILLYALFNVAGSASIKWQLRNRSLQSLSDWLAFVFNLPFILSFLLVVCSALVLIKALSTNQFSLVIPLATGINFILTALTGYFLFNDRVSSSSVLGFLLIIGGIVVLSLNKTGHAS